MSTLALALLLVLTTACLPDPAPAPDEALRVAVGVPPQAWLVEAVGGDAVDVVSVAGPGDSAETYQPTDSEVSRVLSSRLYFRGGVPFERGSWFSALSSAPGLTVVDLRGGGEGQAMPSLMGEIGRPRSTTGGSGDSPAAHDPDGGDPHTWVSPRRLADQARVVADALIKAEPGQADRFEANLEATLETLAILDEDLRDLLAPHAGRSFYVFHPAWGHLAEDYGLRQVAIEVDGKTPSDRELTRLQEGARRARVRVIFVQPQIPHKAADSVAEAVGARTEVLDPLDPDLPANLRHVAERIAASFAAPPVSEAGSDVGSSAGSDAGPDAGVDGEADAGGAAEEADAASVAEEAAP